MLRVNYYLTNGRTIEVKKGVAPVHFHQSGTKVKVTKDLCGQK